MNSFSIYREKYPAFSFKQYQMTQKSKTLTVVFDFAIEGLASFAPRWEIPLAQDVDLNDQTLHQLVFSLGMVEAVSYWKIACPKKMVVTAGWLCAQQMDFFKNLYFHGLGEFFYQNQITTTLSDFLTIECPDTRKERFSPHKVSPPVDYAKRCGALIPVGGGKDSIVTLELLKDTVSQNSCFMIGKRDSSYKSATTAGFAAEQIIEVSRSLDPEMLRLNKEGFLNGHTPFSSIVAFSSVLVAYLRNKRYVILSNESSANEPTVAHSTVNHQYSKSFAFEADFNDYLANFIPCGVSYFSLLRPLSEFQIAGLFAQFTPYHGVFRSCNRGAKQDVWCADCAKCLFVAVILSPFLDEDALCQIFGQNLLDRADLRELLDQLLGIVPDKPFECVGSREEINFALCEAIAGHLAQQKPLAALLRYYQDSALYKKYQSLKNPYWDYQDKQHLIPPQFANLGKERLKKCKTKCKTT